MLFQQTNTQVDAAQLKQQIQETVRQATEAARAAAAADRASQTTRERIIIPTPPLPPSTGMTEVRFDRDIPPRVKDVSMAFFLMIAFIAVGGPLVRAIARRIDRVPPPAPQIPKVLTDQLQQISQSVDAIAIEVERISEGQRFTTKMLGDRQPQQAADITMMAPRSTGQ